MSVPARVLPFLTRKERTVSKQRVSEEVLNHRVTWRMDVYRLPGKRAQSPWIVWRQIILVGTPRSLATYSLRIKQDPSSLTLIGNAEMQIFLCCLQSASRNISRHQRHGQKARRCIHIHRYIYTYTHTRTRTHVRVFCILQPCYHTWPLWAEYCVLFSLGTSFKGRMSFTIFRPYVYSDLRNTG